MATTTNTTFKNFIGGEWVDADSGETFESTSPANGETIGVVGAITPWNFPVAIPSWKLIPALVCGNTVVLKPATDTPALAERFVELLAESGIPSGVVNIVHGGGATVGERMVRHPDVRVITLTGSRETGVEVLKAAAETLTHVHLELGGGDAVHLLPRPAPALA